MLAVNAGRSALVVVPGRAAGDAGRAARASGDGGGPNRTGVRRPVECDAVGAG